MAGEIGVVKKDIAFSGDVLNTTARIQGACHAYKSALLLSTKLLHILALDEGYESETLGSIRLKRRAINNCRFSSSAFSFIRR